MPRKAKNKESTNIKESTINKDSNKVKNKESVNINKDSNINTNKNTKYRFKSNNNEQDDIIGDNVIKHIKNTTEGRSGINIMENIKNMKSDVILDIDKIFSTPTCENITDKNSIHIDENGDKETFNVLIKDDNGEFSKCAYDFGMRNDPSCTALRYLSNYVPILTKLEFVRDDSTEESRYKNIRHEKMVRFFTFRKEMDIKKFIIDNEINYSPPGHEIVSFCQENYDLLNDEEISDILNSRDDCILFAIKYIHFNPRLPQFQNIKIIDTDTPYCLIYRDDEWVHFPTDDALTHLLSTHIARIKPLYIFKNKLIEDNVNKFLISLFFLKYDIYIRFKDLGFRLTMTEVIPEGVIVDYDGNIYDYYSVERFLKNIFDKQKQYIKSCLNNDVSNNDTSNNDISNNKNNPNYIDISKKKIKKREDYFETDIKMNKEVYDKIMMKVHDKYKQMFNSFNNNNKLDKTNIELNENLTNNIDSQLYDHIDDKIDNDNKLDKIDNEEISTKKRVVRKSNKKKEENNNKDNKDDTQNKKRVYKKKSDINK